jgi:hypothetical protein
MGRWFWGQILGKRAFKRLYSEDLFSDSEEEDSSFNDLIVCERDGEREAGSRDGHLHHTR